MLIGILSDTHGRVDRTQQAVRLLESLEVELLVHCGDVGTAEILQLLDRWPTHFVLGNVDSAPALREAARGPNVVSHGRVGLLDLEGKEILFMHGDERRRLQEEIASDRWDLVCYGHTHVAEITTVGRTLVVNPGALHRSSQPSLAAVELPAMRATLVTLEARRG